MIFIKPGNALMRACALLLLAVACKKNSGVRMAPAHLAYSPDTAIVLKGTADTSVTPLINWNGYKGSFTLLGTIPQGIQIDNSTGKISWTSDLPVGTYILPVVARNGASASDTASYTLTVSGKIITIAGGTPGFSGDGGLAVNAQLSGPSDVAMDAQGNLYIADSYNNRIRLISPDGSISTIAGGANFGFAGDGGPATQAELNYPIAITTYAGSLYITDAYNSRIRKIAPNGIISTAAGKDYTTIGFLGDEGPATQAQLYLPAGKVSLDSHGALYIADYGDQRIRKVTSDGIIHTIAGNGSMASPIADGTPALNADIGGPSSVYYDSTKDDLYIISNLSSAVYNLAGGNVFTIADNGLLHRPSNMAVDKQGNLFIADMANNSIRKISTDGVITTVAGNGQWGFSGDGGPAAAARLGQPYGLAVDDNGDLYIADTNNNRIRKVFLH